MQNQGIEDITYRDSTNDVQIHSPTNVCRHNTITITTRQPPASITDPGDPETPKLRIFTILANFYSNFRQHLRQSGQTQFLFQISDYSKPSRITFFVSERLSSPNTTRWLARLSIAYPRTSESLMTTRDSRLRRQAQHWRGIQPSQSCKKKNSLEKWFYEGR